MLECEHYTLLCRVNHKYEVIISAVGAVLYHFVPLPVPLTIVKALCESFVKYDLGGWKYTSIWFYYWLIFPGPQFLFLLA